MDAGNMPRVRIISLIYDEFIGLCQSWNWPSKKHWARKFGLTNFPQNFSKWFKTNQSSRNLSSLCNFCFIELISLSHSCFWCHFLSMNFKNSSLNEFWKIFCVMSSWKREVFILRNDLVSWLPHSHLLLVSFSLPSLFHFPWRHMIGLNFLSSIQFCYPIGSTQNAWVAWVF